MFYKTICIEKQGCEFFEDVRAGLNQIPRSKPGGDLVLHSALSVAKQVPLALGNLRGSRRMDI